MSDTDRFDEALSRAICNNLGIDDAACDRLLAIPGIYEVLSEEFNSAAIDIMDGTSALPVTVDCGRCPPLTGKAS